MEIKQAHRCSSGKPVKYLLEKIVEISQYCVKSPDLSKVLLHWKNCHELRLKCQSLICDSIEKNKVWLFSVFMKGLDPLDVIQKHKARKQSLRDK